MKVTIYRKKLKNGNTSLVLDIHYDSQRWQESTGFILKHGMPKDSRTEAELQANKLREKRYRELKSMSLGKAQTDMTRCFLEYYDEVTERDYRYGGRERRITEETKKSWRSCAKWLELFEIHTALSKRKEPKNYRFTFRDISVEFVRAFREFLMEHVEESVIKQSTACTTYKKFISCLEEAAHEGLIPINPSRKVASIPMPEHDTPALTDEELERLAQTPLPEHPEIKRAYLTCALHLGLGLADLERATWDQVIKQNDGYAFRYIRKKTEKSTNGEAEYLPLKESAMKLLGPRGANGERIFNLPSRRSINKYLKRWCEAAGVWYASPHKARHTFATRLYEGTGDIVMVGRFLGHARDSVVARRYAKVRDRNKRNAINSVPDITSEIVL